MFSVFISDFLRLSTKLCYENFILCKILIDWLTFGVDSFMSGKSSFRIILVYVTGLILPILQGYKQI
jgi:hypothetical protein